MHVVQKAVNVWLSRLVFIKLIVWTENSLPIGVSSKRMIFHPFFVCVHVHGQNILSYLHVWTNWHMPGSASLSPSGLHHGPLHVIRSKEYAGKYSVVCKCRHSIVLSVWRLLWMPAKDRRPVPDWNVFFVRRCTVWSLHGKQIRKTDYGEISLEMAAYHFNSGISVVYQPVSGAKLSFLPDLFAICIESDFRARLFQGNCSDTYAVMQMSSVPSGGLWSCTWKKVRL